MLPTFKECVEEAFVRGLIKVASRPETLALGINMPARSVVLKSW
jgi:ATP-dependent RNA helicase HelY